MQTNHWIWQNSNWPEFSYDASVLLADIGAVSRLAGRLDTIYRTLNNEEQLTVQEQVLADDAMETSAIEGEVLRRSSVRASIRRRLGLSGDSAEWDAQADDLISVPLDAGERFAGEMTTRKYAGMTKCSKVTASRDLSDLVEKHILQQCPGKGRSTSYELCHLKDSGV
jgi:Fic family protein